MPRLDAREYLMLPWSIRGPVEVTDEQGSTHFEMRIAELPDFLVAGASESDVLYEFKEALLAFIDSYTSAGETPPAPKGERASYVAYAFYPGPPPHVEQEASVATAGTVPAPLQLV
jgi:predicted RNase H-like HicB family nuclease